MFCYKAMAPIRQVSHRQLEILVEFAEEHRDIALNNKNSPLEYRDANIVWEELARKLNSVAAGSKKPPEKWKRVSIICACMCSLLNVIVVHKKVFSIFYLSFSLDATLNFHQFHRNPFRTLNTDTSDREHSAMPNRAHTQWMYSVR